MKQKFEFEDCSEKNSIVFEYDEFVEEEFDLQHENGISVMYANKQTLLAVAKLFIKMAIGNYSKGFHIHLTKNFDADEKEIFCVVIID